MRAKKNPKFKAEEVTSEVLKLARLASDFAETYRVTKLPSGQLESDTDHTFMLGLIACSVASKYQPELDVGKVAQYALIHDLVEVHAKDTPTAIASDAEIDAKQQREAKALIQMEKDFGRTFPWIPQTIKSYEELADPESRFIKVLDKALPAVTHLFNNAEYLRSVGIKDKTTRQTSLDITTRRIKKLVDDQPLAHAIRDALEAEASKLFE